MDQHQRSTKETRLQDTLGDQVDQFPLQAGLRRREAEWRAIGGDK